MAEQIKVKPKSDYQRTLHFNYHVKQQLGPVKNCPYCPQELEAAS